MGSWSGNGVKRVQPHLAEVSVEEFQATLDQIEKLSRAQKRQLVAITVLSLGAGGCDIDYSSEEGIDIILKR